EARQTLNFRMDGIRGMLPEIEIGTASMPQFNKVLRGKPAPGAIIDLNSAKTRMAVFNQHRLKLVGNQALGSGIIDGKRHDDQTIEISAQRERRQITIEALYRVNGVNHQIIFGVG